MVAEFPMVSIIMAIRNEATFIEDCLGAILSQQYPHDKLEILIADGESDDETLSKIAQSTNNDIRVTIVTNSHRHQSYGLNQAIQQAKGEIIIRVDGHTIIEPDYVQACVNTLQHTDADCVGGNQHFEGITSMGKSIAIASQSWFSVPSQFRIGNTEGSVDTVYLGAWYKTIFDRIGIFNTTLLGNEDYELCYRIRQAGGLVYLDPKIHSTYYGRQNLKDLWRQYFRYGRSKIQMLFQYPQSTKPRHFVAPLFVMTLIGGVILSFFWYLFFFIWGLSVVSYILLMSIATIQSVFKYKQTIKEQIAHYFRSPFIFMTIHLAWGLGFLHEFGYRLIRWLSRTPHRYVA